MHNFRKNVFPVSKKQQSEVQQSQEERKQLLKKTHTEIPMLEEKQQKKLSALRQEVGQMSMEQLIKVDLKFQKKVKKLRKRNERLAEQIQHGLQETFDFRVANQKKELDALWKYQRDYLSKTNFKVQKNQEQNYQIEKIMQSQKNSQNQQNYQTKLQLLTRLKKKIPLQQ